MDEVAQRAIAGGFDAQSPASHDAVGYSAPERLDSDTFVKFDVLGNVRLVAPSGVVVLDPRMWKLLLAICERNRWQSVVERLRGDEQQ